MAKPAQSVLSKQGIHIDRQPSSLREVTTGDALQKLLFTRDAQQRTNTLSVEDVQPPQMRHFHWPSLSAVEEGGEHHGPVDEDLDAERQPAALEDRDSEAPEDARGLGYVLHDLPV